MRMQKLERNEYRVDCTAEHEDTCRIATIESRQLGQDARIDDAYCQHRSIIRSVVHQWLPA